jgi:hypothetical protein
MPATSQRVLSGCVFILTAAGLLFFLKVKAPRYYALLEISFAILFAAATMYKMNDQIEPSDAAVIGTAIYLLIRGMDNFRADLIARRLKKANGSLG